MAAISGPVHSSKITVHAEAGALALSSPPVIGDLVGASKILTAIGNNDNIVGQLVGIGDVNTRIQTASQVLFGQRLEDVYPTTVNPGEFALTVRADHGNTNFKTLRNLDVDGDEIPYTVAIRAYDGTNASVLGMNTVYAGMNNVFPVGDLMQATLIFAMKNLPKWLDSA